jgi:hypothetical protein
MPNTQRCLPRTFLKDERLFLEGLEALHAASELQFFPILTRSNTLNRIGTLYSTEILRCSEIDRRQGGARKRDGACEATIDGLPYVTSSMIGDNGFSS